MIKGRNCRVCKSYQPVRVSKKEARRREVLARRLRSARKSGDRLKGLGYPDDFGFGPDEPGEDFGTLFYNLSLDNPNFPYAGDPLPEKDGMDWVKGIMDDEEE
jgi:hypothetical protein